MSCYRAAGPDDVANADEGRQVRQFHFWKLGCDRRHESSCLALAGAYADGRGVKRDFARGIALARASCERGYDKGCANWGLWVLMGHGGTLDVPGAEAVCFDGPVKVRAFWCDLLASTIDENEGAGDLRTMARLYQHACSGDLGAGCSHYGATLFRQGKRLEGLELLRTKCEGGLKHACDTRQDLLALVESEERNGGDPLGTPPGPLHLRLPEHGLSYDPPDERWGTSVPTHPGGPMVTMWRWWARGNQIELSLLEGLPKGRAALVAARPERMVMRLAKGAPITKRPGMLGGKPCSHAFVATGGMGRADFFLLAHADVLYGLLVLQQGIFSSELLERALAGFRFEAK